MPRPSQLPPLLPLPSTGGGFGSKSPEFPVTPVHTHHSELQSPRVLTMAFSRLFVACRELGSLSEQGPLLPHLWVNEQTKQRFTLGQDTVFGVVALRPLPLSLACCSHYGCPVGLVTRLHAFYWLEDRKPGNITLFFKTFLEKKKNWLSAKRV